MQRSGRYESYFGNFFSGAHRDRGFRFASRIPVDMGLLCKFESCSTVGNPGTHEVCHDGSNRYSFLIQRQKNHRSSRKTGDITVITYYMKQLISIVFLFLCVIVSDYYLRNDVNGIENMKSSQLVIIIASSIVLFVCNHLLYNYGKAHSAFMQHKIWSKMFVFILIWLMISFVGFILLFTVTPTEEIFTAYPWLMFLVVFYFLFFVNLFVLSIVHKAIEPTAKLERKLVITWITSTFSIALILLLVPII